MLFFWNHQTVIIEVTDRVRRQIASHFGLDQEMVFIQWEPKKDGGGISPTVEIRDPPELPPSELDLRDPRHMSAWQAAVTAKALTAPIVPIDDFLASKGFQNPREDVAVFVRKMMVEVRERLAALEDLP